MSQVTGHGLQGSGLTALGFRGNGFFEEGLEDLRVHVGELLNVEAAFAGWKGARRGADLLEGAGHELRNRAIIPIIDPPCA